MDSDSLSRLDRFAQLGICELLAYLPKCTLQP